MAKRYQIIRFGKKDALQDEDYLLGEKFTVISGGVNKLDPFAFSGDVKMDNKEHRNVHNFRQVYVFRIN